MKIITLNINGLKTNIKQDYLIDFIKEEKPDVFSFQETNIHQISNLNEQYESIKNENIENSISGTILT